ncbi:hypothetical protein CHU98_g10082, partial [Xylaria longipes]
MAFSPRDGEDSFAPKTRAREQLTTPYESYDPGLDNIDDFMRSASIKKNLKMSPNGANATHVAVRTTLPRLPVSERPTIRTERLLMRPLTQDDLEALFSLRREPKFMAESTLGKPDASIAESQAELDKLTRPPAEHFVFGI